MKKGGVFGAVWLNKVSVGKGCLVCEAVLGCQGSIWPAVKGLGLKWLSCILGAVTDFLCAVVLITPFCVCASKTTDGSLASLVTER